MEIAQHFFSVRILILFSTIIFSGCSSVSIQEVEILEIPTGTELVAVDEDQGKPVELAHVHDSDERMHLGIVLKEDPYKGFTLSSEYIDEYIYLIEKYLKDFVNIDRGYVGMAHSSLEATRFGFFSRSREGESNMLLIQNCAMGICNNTGARQSIAFDEENSEVLLNSLRACCHNSYRL